MKDDYSKDYNRAVGSILSDLIEECESFVKEKFAKKLELLGPSIGSIDNKLANPDFRKYDRDFIFESLNLDDVLKDPVGVVFIESQEPNFVCQFYEAFIARNTDKECTQRQAYSLRNEKVLGFVKEQIRKPKDAISAGVVHLIKTAADYLLDNKKQLEEYRNAGCKIHSSLIESNMQLILADDYATGIINKVLTKFDRDHDYHIETINRVVEAFQSIAEYKRFGNQSPKMRKERIKYKLLDGTEDVEDRDYLEKERKHR